MSIILIDKKSALSKEISISSEFVNTTLLKKYSAAQLNCHPSELKLYHIEADVEYREEEVVKQGEKIQYLIQPKADNLTPTQVRKKGVIYPDELEKIIQNSKIIIIKSANEENIQKSKSHSLWATTFSNQEKLKYFFNHYPHVILMFATNRSYEIKGLARMDSEPDKITDKSVWAGVSNIRLGGNFKIKWLRKKPLSLVTVEKSLGANFKEVIIKSCDGQELDPSLCKKLAQLFEIPSEPYYPIDTENTSNSKEMSKPKNHQGDHPIFGAFQEIKVPPLPQIPVINVEKLKANLDQRKRQSSSSSSSKSSSEFQRKNKKIKKQRKKKTKKHRKNKKQHKRHERSSSSSVRSFSEDSDRSSKSERRKRKSKKNRRHKKDKKHRKQGS